MRRRLPEQSFFWLLAVFVVVHAATNLVRPMVSYRALEIGVQPEGLGLLAASFSLAPLVVALSVGRLVDRRGEMAFVVVGVTAIGAASLALAFAGDVAVLLVLFGTVGLGHFLMVVAIQSLVARGSASAGYDRRFGHLSFSASVGQLAGPAIAGLIAADGSPEGTTRALVVGALLGLVALPMIVGMRQSADVTAAARAARASAGPLPPVGQILRTPGVARAILASLTVLSAVDILIIYLPAVGEERGWSPGLVGALLAVRAGASMASRLFLGALAERFGRRLLLVAGMALAAVALVVLPAAGTLPATFAVMVAAGFGLGMCQPLTMAWVAADAAPQARATALSVRLMGNRAGQVVLPIAAGSVAAFGGAAGVLAATGVIVGLSVLAVAGGWRPRRGSGPTMPS